MTILNDTRLLRTSTLALGFLLTASVIGYGQTQPAAAQAPNPTSPVHFEGSDLHLGDLQPISFHGFASQGVIATTDYNYLAGKTTDGSFRFTELGLNASMSPFAHTRIAAQGFAFDLGNIGNYNPVLDYGLIDYNVNEYIGVRAGRLRRPSGIYNQVVDVDAVRTFVLLPQGIYDARWRDFYASVDGGSLYGNFNLGKAGSLSYEIYTGLIRLASDGGIARLVQDMVPPAPIGAYHSVEGSLLYGSQFWYTTPLDGLRAGLAAVVSRGLAYNYSVNPPFGPGPLHTAVNTLLMQYSLEYVVKSWTFQAELETKNNTFHDYFSGMQVGGHEEQPWAWYFSAAYRFNKWLETGTYYTEAYGPAANPADKFQRDLALAFRFDLTRWWALKLEGHVLQGTALVTDKGLNPPALRNENHWFMFAAKTTISF